MSQEAIVFKTLNPCQSLLWGWVQILEVVFSGNEDNYRGFIEVPIKKVTFQNFTIRQMFSNGDDNRGGAAIAYRRNNSDLLVDNMRFINNSVHQSSYHSGGGAIYIERGNSGGGIGNIRIRNSQFISNSVTDLLFLIIMLWGSNLYCSILR